jgi:transcription elongation factor Elf1
MKKVDIFNYLKGGSLFLVKSLCPECNQVKLYNIEQQSGNLAKVKCQNCQIKFIVKT